MTLTEFVNFQLLSGNTPYRTTEQTPGKYLQMVIDVGPVRFVFDYTIVNDEAVWNSGMVKTRSGKAAGITCNDLLRTVS